MNRDEYRSEQKLRPSPPRNLVIQNNLASLGIYGVFCWIMVFISDRVMWNNITSQMMDDVIFGSSYSSGYVSDSQMISFTLVLLVAMFFVGGLVFLRPTQRLSVASVFAPSLVALIATGLYLAFFPLIANLPLVDTFSGVPTVAESFADTVTSFAWLLNPLVGYVVGWPEPFVGFAATDVGVLLPTALLPSAVLLVSLSVKKAAFARRSDKAVDDIEMSIEASLEPVLKGGGEVLAFISEKLDSVIGRRTASGKERSPVALGIGLVATLAVFAVVMILLMNTGEVSEGFALRNEAPILDVDDQGFIVWPE